MNLKALRCQILSGSIARRVLLRAFMLATAISIIPLLQILSGSDPGLLLDSMRYNECDVPFVFMGSNLLKNRFLKPIWGSIDCKEVVNVTTNVARELMGMQMIASSAKALCVGEGSAPAVYALREIGFVNARGVPRHPFFSPKHKRLVYELEYADNSFDFVFSGDLDKVSVPAIVVLEIERVLKPGGIGAMLVGANSLSANSLIRSAMPVSSLLKNSNIAHVGYVNEFTLVVFKKRIYSVGYFQQYQLPADCPSILNNRPHLEKLEPLVENKQVEDERSVAYLPKFIDMPSRKRLIYVEIGGGEHLNSSVSSWFLPSYPVDHNAFNVYFVDHNTSVLLSCVKKPGVTFIYYPGLAGDEAALNPDVEELDPSVADEGFDFLAWFKETVQYADFVVLKMKAGEVELKFLSGLFKSRAVCFVDELFLSCSDQDDDEEGLVKGDCMDLFKSLRNSGVFVHQWWGD